jgi:hypothetical protein
VRFTIHDSRWPACLLALALAGCSTVAPAPANLPPPLPPFPSNALPKVQSPKSASLVIAVSTSLDEAVVTPPPPAFNIPMDFQVTRAPDFDYAHIRTDIIATTDLTVPVFKWPVIGSLATNQTDFYFTATNAQLFLGTVMTFDPNL